MSNPHAGIKKTLEDFLIIVKTDEVLDIVHDVPVMKTHVQ